MPSQKSTTKVEQNFNQLVEDASRFLVKILRHTPNEHGIHLSGRGWASEKEVRNALAREFEDVTRSKGSNVDTFVGSVRLIEAILDADSENRFQRMSAERNAYGMIRATRDHSTAVPSLIPVNVDSDDLNTYSVEHPNGQKAFVTAENETVATQLYQEEVLSASQNPSEVSVEEYTDYAITDAESLLHEGANFLVSQDPTQPRVIEQRVNSQGRSSLYHKSHPYRIRERLPDTPSSEL